MNLTPWKEEDDKTFFQCIARIREGISPIFRLRAVKMIDGNYSAVVRDYVTGKMLASNQPGPNNGHQLDFAQRKAIELAQMVLMYDGSNECIILNKHICPHPTISGKHCSYCKLPDLYHIGGDHGCSDDLKQP